MDAESASRRLAAILVADIAGYGALMSVDEEATVTALKGHQAALLPLIASFNGRVIDLAGDGILAEFGSVLSAVRAGLAMQQAMAERNAEVPPDRRMKFRIGINQGDVIYDDQRIYGDGINIAARLQALAEPGGICISGKVYDEVVDRIDAPFRDLGQRELKNIPRLVRVYAIGGATLPTTAPKPETPAPQPVSVVPFVAVLPFANLSGDAEQDYFADGVVEDIITALSRFRDFAVIARNSSFTYKGKVVDVRVIARELGVRYVLEGSVRKSGNRLRIAAQLVDATNAAHIWAENFDGELADIFDFQDRITVSVAAVVAPQIEQAELERSQRERPDSLAAYDLYLRAIPLLWLIEQEPHRVAIDMLIRASELEPTNAVILSWVARAMQHRVHMGWIAAGPDPVMRDYVERALIHAHGDAMVLANCADILLQGLREYARALQLAQQAVETNPNSFNTVYVAGVTHLHVGSLDSAASHFEHALRLNPRHLSQCLPLAGLAHLSVVRGKYDAAIDWAEKSIARNPRFNYSYWSMAAAQAHLGRLDAAKRYLVEGLRLSPTTTIASLRASQPDKDPRRIEPILEGLRLAGLPEDKSSEPVLPSLAVLPFANLSGDAEQEYFADGVVDDIITALSRFKSFAVIARNSSFTFRGRNVDVRQIARELDVRYVLEGSIRRAGDRLRITAQLVDASTGAHLWGQSFDGSGAEVFAFQDRITESVIGIVEPQVQRAEIDRSRRERRESFAAYDLYLRALTLLWRSDRDNVEAIRLMDRAVALEPTTGIFLAAAVRAQQLRIINYWPPFDAHDTLARLVERAIQHHNGDATVLAICSVALLHALKQYRRAVELADHAVALNPNNIVAVNAAGTANLHCGDVDVAVGYFQRALRLSPLNQQLPDPLTGIAHAHLIKGEHAEALRWAEQGAGRNPAFAPAYWMLTAASSLLGQMDAARQYLARLEALSPGVTVASIRATQPNLIPGRIEPILEGMRLAGMPEN